MNEDYPNLSCKSVQHRLATQWGYVKAEGAVAAEREACARLVEADGLARGEYGYMLTKAAARIRARG